MFVIFQADDTYMQLKKDLEYLDLKVRNIDEQIFAELLLQWFELILYLSVIPLLC